MTKNRRIDHSLRSGLVAAAALGLVAAACGGDGGRARLQATEGFIPVVDGEEQLGCGGYGFRPENRDFRDAFNRELNAMKANDEILPIIDVFGFSEADVQAAKSVTVRDLAANAIQGQSGGGLLPRLQQAGTIRVGFANEIPYGYEEGGEPTGEAPEVAKVVLSRLGINRMEGVVVEFGALINGLRAGQFDMVAAGMFINPERAQEILFSDPDYCASTALAVRAGNPLNLQTFEDIATNDEATLGVLAGAVEEGYATGAGIPDSRIQRFDNTADLFDGLVAGRVDAVALTSITVGEQVERINNS